MFALHPPLRSFAIVAAIVLGVASLLFWPTNLHAQDVAPPAPAVLNVPGDAMPGSNPVDPAMQGVYWDVPPQSSTTLRLRDRTEIIPGADDQVRFVVLLDGAPLSTLVTRPKLDVDDNQSMATVATVDAAAMQRQQDLLAAQQAQFVANAQTAGVQVQVNRNFVYLLNGVAVSTKAGALPTLRTLPGVTGVYPDYQVKANLKDSVPLIGAPTVWQIQDVHGQPVTGDGIDVAIIDTGIDYTHPDLGGCFGPSCRVRGGYDFYNSDNDPIDDDSHGTHVAGIVAASGAITGVAPSAQLWAFKVLSANGSGYASDVIAGVERAADLDGNPLTIDPADVANLSLGGSGNPDDPMSQAVDAAVNAGVTMVIAAGNSGPYAGTIGSPGTARNAITVAASDKQDKIAYFSSRGPISGYESVIKPEITAPGVDITSTVPAASYDAFSGTSMATPHVAGAAALLKQLHPDWSPLRIKSILMNTAKDLGETIFTQGSGRLQIDKAATAPLIVQPALFDLGSADVDDPAWQTSQPITVVNLLDSTATYSLSISATLPASIVAELSDEALTIPPGESRAVRLTIHWAAGGQDVTAAAFTVAPIIGTVLVQNENTLAESRFAFSAAGKLTIRVSDPAEWIMVHSDQAAKTTYYLNPCCAFTLELPFGAYDIIAYFPPSTRSDASEAERAPAWVIQEDIPLQGRYRVVIGRDQATHRVSFETHVGDGSPAASTTVYSILYHAAHKIALFDTRKEAYTVPLQYYSDASSAYQLEARTFARVFGKTFAWYEGYFRGAGLHGDLRLTQDAATLKRKVFEITSGVFDRASAIHRCVAIQLPDGSTMPSPCESVVVKSGLPYVEERYMTPTPADALLRATYYRVLSPVRLVSPFALGEYQDRLDPPPIIPIFPSYQWDVLIGPDIVVAEDGTLRMFATENISVSQVFTTNSDNVPLGAPPPIWIGATTPYTSTACFSAPRNGYLGEQAPFAMRSQAGSITMEEGWFFPSAISIPYALTKGATVVQSGSMSFDRGYRSCIELPSPDEYSMTFTYPQPYSVTGQAANVTAQLGFDTRRLNGSCPDAEPPFLTALELMADGNLLTNAPPENPFTLLLGTADHGADCSRVASVQLEYQTTPGWNTVPLQQVDGYYTGEMPALPAGQPLSLRVTVIDGEGNWLIYRAEPAFEVAAAPALPSETSFTFLPDVMNRR
ncbi:MAG: S8 family serine peptidase [Anaerolineales bacterium]|nr:S8 family serine peptidase [Anaerolineales bacterium]